MKKLILLPKTDTVILCLPEKLVGIPIICKLEPVKSSANINEMELEIERFVTFRNQKRKNKNK